MMMIDIYYTWWNPNFRIDRLSAETFVKGILMDDECLNIETKTAKP